MAEMLRRGFSARGLACRGGDGREMDEGVSGEFRQVVAMAMPADLLQGSQDAG
jgi:hypothetical protein